MFDDIPYLVLRSEITVTSCQSCNYTQLYLTLPCHQDH